MLGSARNAPNWRGRENPWSLAPPPSWWLARLWTRDRALVVMPGLTECCYRIARRSDAMRNAKAVLGNDSETARMIRERCVPVTNLRPDVTWNDDFFVWLDQHDTWAFADPASRLDQLDREAIEKLDAQIADETDQRSVSAYHALQMRTGQKVFVHAPSWQMRRGDQTHGPDANKCERSTTAGFEGDSAASC